MLSGIVISMVRLTAFASPGDSPCLSFHLDRPGRLGSFFVAVRRRNRRCHDETGGQVELDTGVWDGRGILLCIKSGDSADVIVSAACPPDYKVVILSIRVLTPTEN
jgi:hypothetical protein